ncbi:MAG TPA: DUF2813 domain-containing protein, partial [Mariniphaga anaerophila]|nr:DUF2813 domain-containing protein [Mariniphaga anaerophila]
MKLKSFRIEGFRKVLDTTIEFGDASFIIGENNVGKSSVLKALEIFFSNSNPVVDDFLFLDEINNLRVEQIVFTATFFDIPDEAESWRGFKGRIIKGFDASGNSFNSMIYRKTYPLNGATLYEMKEYNQVFKPEYEGASTIKHLLEKGLSEESLRTVMPEFSEGQRLTTQSVINGLRELPELWVVDTETETWFKNPGGIQGNILKRIPKFLLIPAEDRKDEISHRGGALQKTMKDLFEEVRDRSENYKKAQEFLDLLATELNPSDSKQEFGKMMLEVISTLRNVFPESSLHVDTTLSNPDSSIIPTFNVEMSSNVRTPTDKQGMGTIRSAVFALLRYRESFLERTKGEEDDSFSRTLIIGFEEPEIYLHPNAAGNMRDEIYHLATSSTSQIVATTHSPYMIDLGKDLDQPNFPRQILNLMKLVTQNTSIKFKTSISIPFNVTKAFQDLAGEEKDYVKFILKMDDYVSRVFFAKNIIVVEGDTEEIVLKETIKRMPESARKHVLSNFQIIKARGKAAIIALIKYLKALSIDPFVIHDHDKIAGATKFNEPILNALNSPNQRYMFLYCIEDTLG